MKNFIILTITSMFLFSGLSFAAETETECPYMRESTLRENSKDKQEIRTNKPTSSTAVSG